MAFIIVGIVLLVVGSVLNCIYVPRSINMATAWLIGGACGMVISWGAADLLLY